MNKLIRVFAVVFVLVVSCGKLMEKPAYPIIPREDFIALLVKLHLAEALTGTVAFRDSFSTTPSIKLTDSVIKQSGYTKALFDSTVQYYSGYPQEFDAIYDKVITELNRLSVKIKEEEQKQPKDNRPR
jgi:hypothetical protein